MFFTVGLTTVISPPTGWGVERNARQITVQVLKCCFRPRFPLKVLFYFPVLINPNEVLVAGDTLGTLFFRKLQCHDNRSGFVHKTGLLRAV